MTRTDFNQCEEGAVDMFGEKSEDASSRDGSADYLPTTEQQPDSWKGTPPAEGTRRKLILDTIEKFTDEVLGDPTFNETRTQTALADEIESALLKQTIADESEGDGTGSVAANEVTKALNHLIIARRESVDGAELDRINEAITATHKAVEPPAEGMGV